MFLTIHPPEDPWAVVFMKEAGTSSLGNGIACLVKVACILYSDPALPNTCHSAQIFDAFNSDGDLIPLLSQICNCVGSCSPPSICCTPLPLDDPTYSTCYSCPEGLGAACSEPPPVKPAIVDERTYARSLNRYRTYWSGGPLTILYTTEEQEVHRRGGCCNCGAIDDSILTMTDEAGNTWSIILKVLS